ncbi:hypothetical protein J7E50_10665 [Pedobacter sp. ISL-68]|uniref:hypothetical protein n=1 Tax=unclassified Pedobacter TaxID=2628915 RepID=UPI001BEB0B35|nr:MULTISPECIES: hypothetical protein [unclassified Pedobacter]MBT2561292.1 hypothetical protein [Pedobacter sp. ISL-64]MBT2590682.1 hypothetical protein [Pedobacter sp. ISL-68]
MMKNKDQVREKEQKKKGPAECIAFIVLKVQSKWAGGMQRLTSGLSTRALKVWVINIAVLATCYSAFIIYAALWQSDNLFPKIESIQKPLMPVGKNDYKKQDDTLMLLRMKNFHRYLDSMGKSESGRKARDSFLQQRPGLLDSLHHLEELLK